MAELTLEALQQQFNDLKKRVSILEGNSKRKIDEVPLVEIKNAIRYFKDLHYPEDKLANEISKFFGYHRTLSEIIEIIPKL